MSDYEEELLEQGLLEREWLEQSQWCDDDTDDDDGVEM